MCPLISELLVTITRLHSFSLFSCQQLLAYKFKLFINACHLLALILVQSFASNIEFLDLCHSLAHCWIRLKLSLQEDFFHKLGCTIGFPLYLMLFWAKLSFSNLISLDNFEGSGGTVTPSSGFTQPEQIMFGGAPYKFSKISNNICHRHADGNKETWSSFQNKQILNDYSLFSFCFQLILMSLPWQCIIDRYRSHDYLIMFAYIDMSHVTRKPCLHVRLQPTCSASEAR